MNANSYGRTGFSYVNQLADHDLFHRLKTETSKMWRHTTQLCAGEGDDNDG